MPKTASRPKTASGPKTASRPKTASGKSAEKAIDRTEPHDPSRNGTAKPTAEGMGDGPDAAGAEPRGKKAAGRNASSKRASGKRASGKGANSKKAAEAPPAGAAPEMPAKRAARKTAKRSASAKKARLPSRKTFLVAATRLSDDGTTVLQVYAAVTRSPAEALAAARAELGPEVAVELTGKLSNRMAKGLGLEPGALRPI